MTAQDSNLAAAIFGGPSAKVEYCVQYSESCRAVSARFGGVKSFIHIHVEREERVLHILTPVSRQARARACARDTHAILQYSISGLVAAIAATPRRRAAVHNPICTHAHLRRFGADLIGTPAPRAASTARGTVALPGTVCFKAPSFGPRGATGADRRPDRGLGRAGWLAAPVANGARRAA
jgi:hypothetical protein